MGTQKGPWAIGGTIAALLMLYMLVPSAPNTNSGVRGSKGASVGLSAIPSRMSFGIITDLDKRSKVEGKKPKWRATFKRGELVYDGASYSVEWRDEVGLETGHGEKGRGMELSELVMWNNRLYTPDDRTGIVFEIVDYLGPSPLAVPRQIMMEGDGNTDKGFKSEWGTVKDGNLIIGSFGKEYANSDGTIKNYNNNWVVTFTPDGRMSQANWSKQYNAMRKETGLMYPGYMIQEAGAWSDVLGKWVFLPRRMSKDAYDENVDEKKGANSIIVASEDFSDIKVSTVGTLTPERGFSTFKFVPGSKDQHIIAIKSAEDGEADTQTSFITIFTLSGQVLLEETEIAGGVKYEGLEFLGVSS